MGSGTWLKSKTNTVAHQSRAGPGMLGEVVNLEVFFCSNVYINLCPAFFLRKLLIPVP